MAVAAFLEEYDFSGKTIIASCTHFGSGFGGSIQLIQELCPDSVGLGVCRITDLAVCEQSVYDAIMAG
jgi:hypothetical protein